MSRVGRERPGPGTMSFGQAMLYGVGVAAGFFGAAMLLHFSGDIYDRLIRNKLLKKAEEEELPPLGGETVSGMYPLYYRR